MHGFPLRRLALTGTLAVFALAAMTSSAHATVTASTITSPAANSYFFYDANGDPSTLFTVTGTTTSTGNVDIDCDDGAAVVAVLATDVTVLNNTFSVPISTSTFLAKLGSDTCVLRAVPTGVSTGYPPGSSTAFAGPVIAVSAKHADTSTGGVIYDYAYDLSDFAGYLQLTSPGDCGLQYGSLYASGALTPSAYSFRCLGGLFDPDVEEDGGNFGGGIKVDGVEAFDSAAAYAYKSNDGAFPGYQGITLSESFTGGALTIADDEPILDCVPNYTSCTSFEPSGVELDRTWRTTNDGEVALQTDLFRSVDGAQHSIAVLEDDTVNNVTPPGAAFAFPGSSGFQDYAEDATVTLPNGPGTIEFKTDSSTPAAGDGTDPQGGISYASAPNGGAVDFSWSDETSAHAEFVLPYTRTIPAGGSVALRFGYEQDYALSDVQTLAASALASFAPAVTITSPANGATLTASPVSVSGTVNDPTGVTSVKVDGTAAALGAGGAFIAPISLTPGANTITAVATDGDGITGQQQIFVTYKNPPAVTTGKASHISGTGAKIAGKVNPESQTTTYEIQYGTKPTYASHTRPVSVGAGGAVVAITSTLKGLKAKTTYYYRLEATNASGTTYGTGLSFRTGKPSPKGLGAKASPKTAKAFPYHYKVKGKLSRPTGITAKRGCSGKITIKVKRGKKTIYTTHATIGKKCTWSASVSLTHRGKVPGHGKLQITPSFGGNKALATLTGKPLTVRYR
jgi:Glucodextranase, domain B